MNKIPTLDISEASEAISHCTVGFLKLNARRGEETADSVGSGTLVKVGKVHGILTVAHVLTRLPKSGDVGLVRFSRFARGSKQLKFEIGQTHSVIIPGMEGPDGPDIGFLRLPLDKAVELEATSSFRNLDYTAQLLEENPIPAKYGFDGIVGILAERTKKIRTEFGIRMEFESRYQFGTTSLLPDAHGLDRCLFTPGPTDIVPYPKSYGGTSGGGLWRTYCHVDSKGKQQVAENRLIGVPYYQSEKVGEKRLLYCHSPRTIYGLLREKIKETWPDARVA